MFLKPLSDERSYSLLIFNYKYFQRITLLIREFRKIEHNLCLQSALLSHVQWTDNKRMYRIDLMMCSYGHPVKEIIICDPNPLS